MNRNSLPAAALALAGTALLAAPLFWTLADPFGDWRKVSIAAGTMLLMLGVAVAFLPYRAPLLPASRTTSGGVLVGIALALFPLGPLFNEKGAMFLWGTCWLAGLLVGVAGLIRIVIGLARRD